MHVTGVLAYGNARSQYSILFHVHLYRLLGDVKSYKTEMADFEKTRAKHESIADAEERASKLRLLANMVDETNLAIQDCINRAGLAQTDLYSAITSYPATGHGDAEYKDAVAVYGRSGELELPFDEDLVNQCK